MQFIFPKTEKYGNFVRIKILVVKNYIDNSIYIATSP